MEFGENILNMDGKGSLIEIEMGDGDVATVARVIVIPSYITPRLTLRNALVNTLIPRWLSRIPKQV